MVAARNIVRLIVAVVIRAAFGWSGKYDDVSVRCFMYRRLNRKVAVVVAKIVVRIPLSRAIGIRKITG